MLRFARRLPPMLLLLALLPVVACGQITLEPPAAPTPTASSPAAASQAADQPADQTPATTSAETVRILARNVVALRQHIGQRVTVFGLIDRTGRSKSGHQFLNFANSEFTATILRQDVPNFVDGAPTELFANKQAEVTGQVELFKGKVQIRVTSPDQIRLLAPPAAAKVVAVELKELGTDVWQSPAGLRYAGRDPAGLNRVEHIERHCRDLPDRDGPHGVFDGGKGVAFAVIDEAWRTALERDLRANREGNRSSYTVSMGRRVGYLGGRTGAERNRPPLERVFIVFETGTKNIITAFPK